MSEAGVSLNSIRCVEPFGDGGRAALMEYKPGQLLGNVVDALPETQRAEAWLDWEYAWLGDPAWDHASMDIFRLKPIGPTPAAFFEGYGAVPKDPERTIYELSIYLWMANQYLDGEVDEERVLMPTYEAAMRYLGRVDEVMGRIDGALEMC